MIDKQDLNRCIEILATLHANARSTTERELILEMGYIIKQELDLISDWEKNPIKPMEINRLLEDNKRLYNENRTLLETSEKLKRVIGEKLPRVQENLAIIKNKYDIINSHLENSFC